MSLANTQWSSGTADSAVGDRTSNTIFNQYWALKMRPHFPRFLVHDSWILIAYHPNRPAARGIKHSRIGIQSCTFRNYPFVSGQKCPATPGLTAPTTSYLLSKGVYAPYDPGLAHRCPASFSSAFTTPQYRQYRSLAKSLLPSASPACHASLVPSTVARFSLNDVAHSRTSRTSPIVPCSWFLVPGLYRSGSSVRFTCGPLK